MMKQSLEPGGTSGADYSAVDSGDKARRLVETGELVALLMLPEEFGGDHRRENIVYVPPFVAQIKERVDGDIARLIEEEQVREYNVKPIYAGVCLVPIGITITATAPSTYARHIPIWTPPPTPAV